MWRTHFYILAVFILLVVPVYLVDNWLLKPQRGGSFLDLSGLFVLFYLAFLVGQIIFSSAGLWLFRPGSLASLHVVSAVISILSIGLGLYAIESYHSMRTKEAHQEKMEARVALYDDVVLEKWWYLPEAEAPDTVYAELSFKRGGRFSANMSARESDENSEMKFSAEMDRPISVEAGDRHIVKMTVEHYEAGKADYARFSLFLFTAGQGRSDTDTVKVYVPTIDQKDDGKVMYARLPDRSSAP